MQTHGQSHTRLYHIWKKMKGRCLNPNHQQVADYAGRGITVCDEWHDFEPFWRWSMANGYNDGLTIDREDNDGNYDPNNARWVPIAEQLRNRRNTLDWGKVEEIRHLRTRGWTIAALSRRYGKAESTIGAVVNRKSWVK